MPNATADKPTSNGKSTRTRRSSTTEQPEKTRRKRTTVDPDEYHEHVRAFETHVKDFRDFRDNHFKHVSDNVEVIVETLGKQGRNQAFTRGALMVLVPLVIATLGILAAIAMGMTGSGGT